MNLNKKAEALWKRNSIPPLFVCEPTLEFPPLFNYLTIDSCLLHRPSACLLHVIQTALHFLVSEDLFAGSGLEIGMTRVCTGPAPLIALVPISWPSPVLCFRLVREWTGPGPRLNCAVILSTAPPAHWLPSFFSVTGRKAKAVYPCEAEHDSELSFQVGAIFNAGKCYRQHQSLPQNRPWHIGFERRPESQSDLQSERGTKGWGWGGRVG